MMCFRDMTFCGEEINHDCKHRDDCHRAWNKELQKAANEWLANPPICFFGGIPNCHEDVK